MKKIPLFILLYLSLSTIAQVNITVGPYLQSPTPSSIKIKWRTDSLTASKIVYGTDLLNQNLSTTDTAITTNHTIKLSGLTPYTKYYYSVYNGNTLLEGNDAEHWFRTFPTAGTELPFRVWGIGDFGKGNDKQAKVRDAYVNFDTTETSFFIWLGDNAYGDGTEQEYLTQVFDSVYGYKNVMKHWAFLPSPGNHDYNSVSPVASPTPPLTHTGPYYNFIDVYTQGEAGGVPTGHELFYSYDYGNAHFISLNSELGSIFTQADDWIGVSPFNSFSSSPLTTWLEADLTANTKPWVIVYFHQPPYTDGSHDAGAFWEIYMQAIRENICHIWEEHGVDLVVCGHSHVYERSYLVKGAYGSASDINFTNYVQNTNGIDSMGQAFLKYTGGANPNQGTVYVVNGNSGSTDDAPSFQHPYMFAEYGCDTCIGSFVLDINGSRLDGRHLDGYGNIRDHFTIKKIAGADPNAISEVNDLISTLKIAPNPFSSVTQILYELTRSEKIEISLTDAVGKRVELFEGNLASGSQQFEIDAQKLKLSKGIYSLQFSSATQRISRNLIVQ